MKTNNVGVALMKQGSGGMDNNNNNNNMVVELHVHEGDFSLLRNPTVGGSFYDKSLPCFGCGIGWFSFLFGFCFPPIWYYATFLYLGNHYLKDPRERSGLAASAIATLIFSVAVLTSLIAVFCSRH